MLDWWPLPGPGSSLALVPRTLIYGEQMCHDKSNLALPAPSLLYEPIGDGIVRIEWRGDCDYTAADILAPPRNRQQARDDAKTLIMDMLAKGPLEQQAIHAKAIEVGIAWRTVERAKGELGVVSHRKGFGPGSVILWKRPAEKTPIHRQ